MWRRSMPGLPSAALVRSGFGAGRASCGFADALAMMVGAGLGGRGVMGTAEKFGWIDVVSGVRGSKVVKNGDEVKDGAEGVDTVGK